ncbi:MAG: hypothetical protein K8S54_03730 [Spirochaetia bacterium]|nr:hypothetical protein [Spirochaetia bacterium]
MQQVPRKQFTDLRIWHHGTVALLLFALFGFGTFNCKKKDIGMKDRQLDWTACNFVEKPNRPDLCIPTGGEEVCSAYCSMCPVIDDGSDPCSNSCDEGQVRADIRDALAKEFGSVQLALNKWQRDDSRAAVVELMKSKRDDGNAINRFAGCYRGKSGGVLFQWVAEECGKRCQ